MYPASSLGGLEPLPHDPYTYLDVPKCRRWNNNRLNMLHRRHGVTTWDGIMKVARIFNELNSQISICTTAQLFFSMFSAELFRIDLLVSYATPNHV